MQVDQNIRVPKNLEVLASLAHLLERLERLPRAANADQYRSVVRRITQELATAAPGGALQDLLAIFPATGELYENLRYEQAGLCLHPLEQSLDSERAAAQALRRAARAGRAA